MWVWLIIVMVLMFIVGSGLILLRTAGIPKVPKGIKSQPYDDNEDTGW